MADAKITALTALTAPAPSDLLPIVDDVAGTPTTKKITVADLMAGTTWRAPATHYQVGREWFTDFGSATADAFIFDVTNFTYGTDGGPTAISPTTPGTIASIVTKERLADCEVLVKARWVAGAGFNIVNVAAQLVGRYLDIGNYWVGGAQASTSNNKLTASSIARTVSAGATPTAVGTFDNADATTYRWLRMRLTGDIIRMKWWFHGSAEPAAWPIQQRLRYPLNGASPNTTTDNVEYGSAGLLIQYGGFVQVLKVTELIRADNNLIVNPSPIEISTDGTDNFPVPWGKASDTGSDVRSVVSVADRFGETRAVFKCHKESTDVNLMWVQNLWRGGAPHTGVLTRKMPWPRVNFPQAIEVSLWSKGTGVVVPGNIGPVIDIYTYDDVPTTLYTASNYWATLGPNGASVFAGGGKGDGTWDWYETRFRMHLDTWERVTRMLVQVGFHDSTATGDLWFTDVQLIPVA
jgi:hypothetical protein